MIIRIELHGFDGAESFRLEKEIREAFKDSPFIDGLTLSESKDPSILCKSGEAASAFVRVFGDSVDDCEKVIKTLQEKFNLFVEYVKLEEVYPKPVKEEN